MKFCFAKKNFIEVDNEPNKLAVAGEDRELSWGEFQSEVGLLVNFFIENNLDKLEFPVIVYGHKSARMIVSIYALIKLNIPYIPVDVIYPVDRVVKIQKASQSQVVINTKEHKISLPETNELQFKKGGFVYSQLIDPTTTTEKVEDPVVYTIFTSGSTGDPKGVMISTEAVRSFSRWMTSADFKFSSNDVFVNTAILSFDLSVFELITFGALGATILLNNKVVVADPNKLLDRVQYYRGSVWVSTPSFAFTYSRIGADERLNSLRTFLFCGEVLPQPLAKSLLTNFPQAKVLNTYGPTEATVATTIIDITNKVVDSHSSLPVGFCRAEGEIVIENEEIIIVGPHVSKGYVNNESLNREKFFLKEGRRAFRTGDQGYLEDGILYFNGRNDDLVKLHGYRIELNEITSVLLDLEYIFQAETIALKRNGVVKKIVSLACLRKGSNIRSKEEIKKDLSANLPVYMIPGDIKIVGEIPLNSNGKADKKLLTELYLKR